MKKIKHFLSFSLGEGNYGIDIDDIQQVIYMIALIPIPTLQLHKERKSSILGLANLQGKIIPVLSLRKLFGMAEDQFTTSSRILIIHLNKNILGLIADKVCGVVDVDEENFQSLETKGSADDFEFVQNIYQKEEKVFLILKGEKLLSQEEINIVGSLQK